MRDSAPGTTLLVVAGQDRQRRAGERAVLSHPGEIAGRLLHRRKTPVVAAAVQNGEVGGVQFRSGAAGNDVRNQRDIGHVVGDDFVVFGAEFEARGRVVVAVHDERRAGAGVLRVEGGFDGFVGAVRPGAGEHARATGGGFDGFFDDLIVLGPRQRRRFAGGARGEDAGHAFGDLELDQAAIRFGVQRAVVLERRNQRGPDA
jgi:hypothetical protein